MLTRRHVVVAISTFAIVGCQETVSVLAEHSVIEVNASYPGATPHEVADTIAATIEQQINGVEGVVRIESQSSLGKYHARLHCAVGTDTKAAAKLVQRRVALARPKLSAAVQIDEVSVKVGKTEVRRNLVAIAVIDRQGLGWKSLEKCAGAVLTRMEADRVANPTAYPVDEKQVSIQVDRERCARLGVKVADVHRAIQSGNVDQRIDKVKSLPVSNEVVLEDVAEIKEIIGPVAVYRINLHPAILITGAPPEGKTAVEIAEKCVSLAEAEIKRLHSDGFQVENLSTK